MALIKYRELARRIQLEGMASTVRHFGRALREGALRADDFSLRELAEATVFTRDGEPCGREWVAGMNPSRGEPVSLLEADGAVDSTAFANLTAQLVYNSLMKGYAKPEFINGRLCRTIPSKLKKELIPGISGMVDDVTDTVSEMMPYPQIGFGEDYKETPVTAKRGRIVGVTKEAIFHDQTGLIIEAAGKIGEVLAIRREKNFAKLVLGVVNNYKWKGTSYNTYQTSAPWINVKATNGITVADGWAKIDASEQLFNNMLEPNTGEPITVSPKTILAMPARTHQFRRVIGASEIRDSQDSTAAHSATTGANTVDKYELVFSRWLFSELKASGVSASDAADWWFHGDFQEAFAWIENWPMTVVQAPNNSEAEFLQDIVLRFKASEKGVHAVMEPRAVVKNYQA